MAPNPAPPPSLLAELIKSTPIKSKVRAIVGVCCFPGAECPWLWRRNEPVMLCLIV